MWKHKRNQMVKIILEEKKNNSGGIAMPDFKAYYSYSNITTWNKIEDSNMSAHHYSQLIVDKDGKVHSGEKTAPSTGMLKCWENIVHKKLDPHLSPYTNINCKTPTRNQKCSKYPTRKRLLSRIPFAQELRLMINKWDIIEAKILCTVQGTHSRKKMMTTA